MSIEIKPKTSTTFHKLEVIREGPDSRKFFLNGQELEHIVADSLEVEWKTPTVAIVTLSFVANEVILPPGEEVGSDSGRPFENAAHNAD